jgi:hypothetical protein
MATKKSGQGEFVFTHCGDLSVLPKRARPHEIKLHGGFSTDLEGDGCLYYGMPGCGLMRVRPDLTTQDIIELPSDLKPINFHSTKVVKFDGKRRLVLPANENAKVVVLGLDGSLEFVLPRPEFEEYQDETQPFAPTDTAAIGDRLYVADGYGSNYISTADLPSATWIDAFGGKTKDSPEPGKFGTAHGMNVVPGGQDERHLSIADRAHSRFQVFTAQGAFKRAYGLPPGSRPCGIDFHQFNERLYALVGSLDDPAPGRPAPIYILDAATYEVVSTVRPKEELDVQLADHIHNTIWHEHEGRLFLVCQAWNPGHYFVLERAT